MFGHIYIYYTPIYVDLHHDLEKLIMISFLITLLMRWYDHFPNYLFITCPLVADCKFDHYKLYTFGKYGIHTLFSKDLVYFWFCI